MLSESWVSSKMSLIRHCHAGMGLFLYKSVCTEEFCWILQKVYAICWRELMSAYYNELSNTYCEKRVNLPYRTVVDKDDLGNDVYTALV